MDTVFRKRRKEGVITFKMYGILSCKACAEKWKFTLMKKGKKVRLRKTDKGWEVWAI